MLSPLFAWLAGLTLSTVGGVALALAPLTFSYKVMIACAMVFFVDKLGGRWFGYTSLLVLFAGLYRDPSHAWALVLPLLIGSSLVALVLRHAEPGWIGVLLVIVGFAAPVLVLSVVQIKLDPTFKLPARYLQLHLTSGTGAIVLSNLLETLVRWRKFRVKNPPSSAL
jgi:hypothetical protein